MPAIYLPQPIQKEKKVSKIITEKEKHSSGASLKSIGSNRSNKEAKSE